MLYGHRLFEHTRRCNLTAWTGQTAQRMRSRLCCSALMMASWAGQPPLHRVTEVLSTPGPVSGLRLSAVLRMQQEIFANLQVPSTRPDVIALSAAGKERREDAAPMEPEVVYSESACAMLGFDVDAVSGQDVAVVTDQECLVYLRRPL